MIDFEYEILCYIRSNQSPLWSEVLNAFNPSENINITNSVLKAELKAGMIEKTSQADRPPLCRIRLSPEGNVALSAEKQRREEQALIREENIRKEQAADEKQNRILKAQETHHEKEKRSDRKFQLLLAVFQAFLSFVAGLLVEHFAGLIDLVSSLIQSHS